MGHTMTKLLNLTTLQNQTEHSSSEMEPVWEVCGGAAFPDSLAASPTERRPRRFQPALQTSVEQVSTDLQI